MEATKFPRQMYLLMLLAADRGRPIKGRVRLQKLVFLIRKKIVDEKGLRLSDEHYRFIPYSYGPYSYEILDDVDFLKDLGLIEVKTGRNPQVNEEYRITEKGKDFVKKFLENSINAGNKIIAKLYEEIENLKKKYGYLPVRKLINYVYIEYPEYTDKSVIREAVMHGYYT